MKTILFYFIVLCLMPLRNGQRGLNYWLCDEKEMDCHTWAQNGDKTNSCIKEEKCAVLVMIKYNKDVKMNVYGNLEKGHLRVTLKQKSIDCDTFLQHKSSKYCRGDFAQISSNFSRTNPPLMVEIDGENAKGQKIRFKWPTSHKGQNKSLYFYIGLSILAIAVLVGLWVDWQNNGPCCGRWTRGKRTKKKRNKRKLERMEQASRASLMNNGPGMSSSKDQGSKSSQGSNLPSIETISSTTGLTRDGRKPESFNLSPKRRERRPESPIRRKKGNYQVGSPGKHRRG